MCVRVVPNCCEVLAKCLDKVNRKTTFNDPASYPLEQQEGSVHCPIPRHLPACRHPPTCLAQHQRSLGAFLRMDLSAFFATDEKVAHADTITASEHCPLLSSSAVVNQLLPFSSMRR